MSLPIRPLLAAAFLAVACNGTAVIDAPAPAPASEEGGGGSQPQCVAECSSPAECPDGVCVFEHHVCSRPCATDADCPASQRCEPCATSSCKGCKDCVSACITVPGPDCFDAGDCGEDGVCIGWRCYPGCNRGNHLCDDPNVCCNGCFASIPSAQDCLGACLGPVVSDAH